MKRLNKEEAENCYEAVIEIMEAFPKSTEGEFIGHFNDVMLFLEEAMKSMPSEKVE